MYSFINLFKNLININYIILINIKKIDNLPFYYLHLR